MILIGKDSTKKYIAARAAKEWKYRNEFNVLRHDEHGEWGESNKL